MDVFAAVGEQVAANAAILRLADLENALICLWVEEADSASVVEGNRVAVVFEAFPDDTYAGEVVRVDPLLVTVDGTPAVQAWARLDLGEQQPDLLAGMTAEVEVTAAEARNALLVPVAGKHPLSGEQLRPSVAGFDKDCGSLNVGHQAARIHRVRPDEETGIVAA